MKKAKVDDVPRQNAKNYQYFSMLIPPLPFLPGLHSNVSLWCALKEKI
jgi:hypothetical protein